MKTGLKAPIGTPRPQTCESDSIFSLPREHGVIYIPGGQETIENCNLTLCERPCCRGEFRHIYFQPKNGLDIGPTLQDLFNNNMTSNYVKIKAPDVGRSTTYSSILKAPVVSSPGDSFDSARSSPEPMDTTPVLPSSPPQNRDITMDPSVVSFKRQRTELWANEATKDSNLAREMLSKVPCLNWNEENCDQTKPGIKCKRVPLNKVAKYHICRFCRGLHGPQHCPRF